MAKVYFFDGGTLVGTATVAPYSVALTNLATGTHTLTAIATDNVGLSTTSAAVSIIIIVDTPPTVTITGPANNAVFIAPANITVTATAGDADGNVAKVDFFDGATLVGTATAAPFGVALANLAAGAHTLTAIATDNLGASTTSAAVSIIVDTPPTVTITGPANNASFTTPANVSLTANATDSDGTVAKVDFFDGGTLVGTATAAPFGVTIAYVAAGAHTLTARATDNLGASTTSAAVSILVDSPPTVTITGPANNAVFIAPANITVTATAGDADGNVAKVDFFDGATLVGTATAAPFGVTLANVAAGAHTLTAIATDNLGLSTTSAGVSIQVDGPAELLWTDVASDLVAVNRGATGDMWIANVDMARLPQVKLQDSQPYWFKYLRSFWTSTGVYVGSGCPAIWYPSLSEATDTRYPYRIQAVDVNGVKIGLMHLGGPQGQITSRAAALTSTDPYISPPQAEFQTGPFYCIYTLKAWTIDAYTTAYAFVPKVIRRKVGEGVGGSTWYPSNVWGAAFYQMSDPSGTRVYGAPSIWLNKETIAGFGSLGGNTFWTNVDPGGVTADGWGVVPTDVNVTTDSNGQPRWIYVKSRNNSARWTSCTIPIPTCSDSVGPIQVTNGGPIYYYWQSSLAGFVAFNELRVYDTMSWATAVSTLGGPLDEVVSFGAGDSISASDYNAQGWYYLTSDGIGGASLTKLTLADVQAIRANATTMGDRTVFVNGSGNNFDSASSNATATLNAYLLQNMIWLYEAQRASFTSYVSATINNENNGVQLELSGFLSSANTAPGATNLITHSWGGQIAARTFFNGAPTGNVNWLSINTANTTTGDIFLSSTLSNFAGTVSYGYVPTDPLSGATWDRIQAAIMANSSRIVTVDLNGGHGLQTGVYPNNLMYWRMPLR